MVLNLKRCRPRWRRNWIDKHPFTTLFVRVSSHILQNLNHLLLVALFVVQIWNDQSDANFRGPKFEERVVHKNLFFKNIAARKIYDELTQTMPIHCLSYSRVKSLIGDFRRGRKRTEDEERLGNFKTLVTKENVSSDQDMILAESRIGLQRMADK